jgi:hypothetical protein
MQEAIEWAMRVPDLMGEGKDAQIELRQVFEASDFPPDIFPPEERARGKLAGRGAPTGGTMSKVVGGMTMSLDGFVTDRNGRVDRLYPDLEAFRKTEMLQEQIRTTGAVVMGRHAYHVDKNPTKESEHER